MTTISTHAEEAREAARTAAGQFGAQEHSAPEAQLDSARSIDLILSGLADQYGSDSYRFDRKANQARLESFVADARKYVPEATSAQFRWDYELGGTRLAFDCYLDEHGDQVDDDSGEYPDINDFEFDNYREAQMYGFGERENLDGAVITFDDVPARDEAKARAELAVAHRLRDTAQSQDVRSLLVAAMNHADGVPAERFHRLSDHDLEQVEGILASAIQSTANYLRHS